MFDIAFVHFFPQKFAKSLLGLTLSIKPGLENEYSEPENKHWEKTLYLAVRISQSSEETRIFRTKVNDVIAVTHTKSIGIMSDLGFEKVPWIWFSSLTNFDSREKRIMILYNYVLINRINKSME